MSDPFTDFVTDFLERKPIRKVERWLSRKKFTIERVYADIGKNRTRNIGHVVREYPDGTVDLYIEIWVDGRLEAEQFITRATCPNRPPAQ